MGATKTAQDTGYAWFVAAVLCLCSACSTMDRAVLPLLVKPLEHSLGLSDTAIGLLQGAAFSLTFALFGLPLSRFVDNGHRRNIIIAGVVAWSVATMACGLAQNASQLFIGRMCVGVAEAVMTPSAVSILADYFSVRRRTRAISFNTLGSYLGAGLALLFGGTLIRVFGPAGLSHSPFGPLETWRAVFVVIGASGLVLVPLLLAIREPARHATDGTGVASKATLKEIIAIFTEKRGALFACIMGFTMLVMGHHAVIAWAPTLFVRNDGWDLAKVGQTLGLLNIVMSPLGVMTGALLSEWFERSLGRRDGKFLVGILSGLCCALTAFAFTLPSKNGALIAIAALQFTVTFNFGLTHAAIAELLPNRARGFGAACFIAATNIVAASGGPLLVGLLDDHVFHDPGMLAVSVRLVAPAAFLLGTAILVLGLKSYRHATAPAVHAEV